MKYFQVTLSSEHFCGFETTRYIPAIGEDFIYDREEYVSFEEEMREYINGHCDADDYKEHEDPTALLLGIEDSTKEKYEEKKTCGNCG